VVSEKAPPSLARKKKLQRGKKAKETGVKRGEESVEGVMPVSDRWPLTERDLWIGMGTIGIHNEMPRNRATPTTVKGVDRLENGGQIVKKGVPMEVEKSSGVEGNTGGNRRRKEASLEKKPRKKERFHLTFWAVVVNSIGPMEHKGIRAPPT